MTGGQMLAQKTVLIIGGTSGFGHEVARQAAAQGAVLRLVGRDAAKAEAVAQVRAGAAAAEADSAMAERAVAVRPKVFTCCLRCRKSFAWGMP